MSTLTPSKMCKGGINNKPPTTPRPGPPGAQSTPAVVVDEHSIVNLKNRARFYNSSMIGQRYPDSQLQVITGRFISGVWMMGNNYRSKSKLYGAYPPAYMPRMETLFLDKMNGRVLHVFSGSLPPGQYTRVDINQEAEINGDAHNLYGLLSKHQHDHDSSLPLSYDVIFADPPYSAKDAKNYGTKMINRKKVLKECSLCLKPGGFIVWLDTVFPMFRKDELHICGLIGIIRSTNHRVRTAFIFRKA